MQKQYERSIGLVESRLKHMHGKPVNVEHHAGADARRFMSETAKIASSSKPIPYELRKSVSAPSK